MDTRKVFSESFVYLELPVTVIIPYLRSFRYVCAYVRDLLKKKKKKPFNDLLKNWRKESLVWEFMARLRVFSLLPLIESNWIFIRPSFGRAFDPLGSTTYARKPIKINVLFEKIGLLHFPSSFFFFFSSTKTTQICSLMVRWIIKDIGFALIIVPRFHDLSFDRRKTISDFSSL